MFKKTLNAVYIGALFLLYTNYVFSQNNNQVLVYANKTDFLVPFIKTTLEEMVDNNSGVKIFARATNLNLLFVNTDADKLLRNALSYSFPNQSFRSIQDSNLKDSIFKVFIQNNYFLLVNENILQDKIEFQLILYKIAKDTSVIQNGLNDFPIKNIIRPIAENNFFINISSSDYLSSLKNGIKKLIPESGIKTNFKVKIDGNINKTDSNTILTSNVDTLSFSVYDVVDDDSPIGQIDFKIHVIDNNDISNRPYATSKSSNSTFKINFTKPGEFKIFISSYDGISYSYSDTFNFEVINIPKIFSFKQEIRKINVESIWRPYAFKLNIPVYILGEDLLFDFKAEFKEHTKPIRKAILDSLKSELNFKKMLKAMSGSYYYFVDEPKIEITKKDENFYTLGVTRFIDDIDDIDSSINIYGVTRGLFSNTENVKLEMINIGPVSVQSEVYFNNFKMKKDNCKCGIDSANNYKYISYNPLNIRFKIFSTHDFNFGVGSSVGLVINTDKEMSKFDPIDKIKGMSKSVDIFVSKFFLINNLIFDFSFAGSTIFIPISSQKANSYNQYGAVNGYFVYGANSKLSVTSIKMKRISLFIGGNLGYGKSDGVKYRLSSLGTGIAISF